MSKTEKVLSYTPESLKRKRKLDGNDMGRLTLYAASSIAKGDTEVQQKEWYREIARKYEPTEANERIRDNYRSISAWLAEGRALASSGSIEVTLCYTRVASFLDYTFYSGLFSTLIDPITVGGDRAIGKMFENIIFSSMKKEYRALEKDTSPLSGYVADIKHDSKYVKGYNAAVDILSKKLDVPELEVFKEKIMDFPNLRETIDEFEKMTDLPKTVILRGMSESNIKPNAEMKRKLTLFENIKKQGLELWKAIDVQEEYPRKEQLEMAVKWVDTKPMIHWCYGLAYILTQDKGDPSEERNF